MKASALSFRAAPIFLIVGIAWGLTMGISQDHSTMPAHAHLNLLGWVSLFLMGAYYRLHPTTDVSKLALAQVAIWTAGSIFHPVGLGLLMTGYRVGGPMLGFGSLQLLGSSLMFGWQVFRGETATDGRRSVALASTRGQ